MADLSTCLPLTPNSISQTHARIRQHIHYTPLLTCHSLNAIASHPTPRSFLADNPPSVWEVPSQSHSQAQSQSPTPKFSLYFKMESTQRIGAFKARGAFSALTHLANPPSSQTSPGIGLPTLRRRGVVTHSSGNHAQALALAASTLNVPATIVMPSISTKSKISGTKNTPGVRVVFSGSTSVEREEVVARVIEEGKEKDKEGGEGPILVPPYDHVDIALGQGTAALEMEGQFGGMKMAEMQGAGSGRKACSFAVDDGSTLTNGASVSANGMTQQQHAVNGATDEGPRFDAVITPLGGGGLLSGTATWFSHTRDSESKSNSRGNHKPTLVFGAEPSFQGANDGERGLASTPPQRIEHVSTLTIADGLRTPLGKIPWSVISDKSKVEGIYSVSELEIKMALKLVMERMKVVIEPSAAVPLAVVLFNERFRRFVGEKQKEEGSGRAWDVGIIFSGGNTTVEALSGLFGEGWLDEREDKGVQEERAAGVVGRDGERVAEDIAG